MVEEPAPVSLLPWLNRNGSRVTLDISMRLHEEGEKARCQPVICGGTALTRLLQARFLTGAGSVLKNVFLLSESERYSLPEGSLLGFGNSDIEVLWDNFLKKNNESSVILLENQFKNRLFQSVFLCVRQKNYFHPWCPDCGAILNQCIQDEILKEARLPSYKASLRRFLYCHSCCSSKKIPIFYSFDREEGDPPSVFDRWSLVRSWGQKVHSQGAGSIAPCQSCPDRASCFGPEGLATSRVYPLFFYNFHLAILESGQLPAKDFLARISGASTVESAAGRQPDGPLEIGVAGNPNASPPVHLFAGSNKLFKEILYLKIAFLWQVSRQVLSGKNGLHHPALEVDLNQFWVETPESEGLLPFVWNFRVRPMAIHIFPGAAESPNPSKSLLLHNLSLLWLDGLLGTKNKDLRGIFGKLTELPNSLSSDACSFSIEALSLFPPEQIYWDSSGATVSQNDHLLWREALSFAGKLFFHSHNFLPDWPVQNFFEELEAFAKRIKKDLFQERAAVSVENVQENNLPAREILQQILATWESKIYQEISAPPSEMMDETVLLPRATPPGAPVAEAPERPNPLDETVILGPGLSRPAHPLSPVKTDEGQGPEGSDVQGGGGPAVDEILPSTVILTPEDLKRLRKEK